MQTHARNSVWFTRLSNRLASYFVAIVLIFNQSWMEMHVFDVLTTLQLLVSNICAQVTPDNIRSFYNFCSENGQNSPNMFFALNSPNFPTTKVSLHTVFG